MDSAQSQCQSSDEKLVKNVLKGDKESYGVLIDRYKNLAFRQALSRVGDFDMAEDIVQDAFMRGFENLTRLQAPGRFASWIAGITTNLCREVQRKRRIRSVSLDYLMEIGIEPGDPGNTSDYDQELILAIRKFVPQLKEKYREIIELRYTREYSCEKIANYLGLSQSAVFSRLHYARKHLSKMLKKEGLI
jgi:RNA polymerase sigma-70 factor (ECF subfamily)